MVAVVGAEAFCRSDQRRLLVAVPSTPGLSRIVFDGDLVLVSPRTGHVDTTDCEITLRPRALGLDPHAVRRYLNSFAGRALEHEEAAVAVAADVAAVCCCRVVVVVSDVVDESLSRACRALAYPAMDVRP